MSILPSKERPFEEAQDEHECPVWPGDTMATCPPQIHSEDRQGVLLSDRFKNSLHMWKLIHSLGSNTKSRFETTRFLRSNEGGLAMCYMPYVDWPKTSKSRSELCPCKHWIPPSVGGRANLPPAFLPFGPHVSLAPTWKGNFVLVFAIGIFVILPSLKTLGRLSIFRYWARPAGNARWQVRRKINGL